jgi:hypothetical protein
VLVLRRYWVGAGLVLRVPVCHERFVPRLPIGPSQFVFSTCALRLIKRGRQFLPIAFALFPEPCKFVPDQKRRFVRTGMQISHVVVCIMFLFQLEFLKHDMLFSSVFAMPVL